MLRPIFTVLVVSAYLTGCGYSKLTSITADNWAVGEYKYCTSTQSNESRFLDCTADSASSAKSKLFMVRFYHDFLNAADDSSDDQPSGTLYHWQCRKTDDSETPYNCEFKSKEFLHSEQPAPTSPPSTYRPSDQETGTEEDRKQFNYNFQQQNACQFRFVSKGIFKLGSKTIDEACEGDPNIQPPKQ
jgi:hypothetical protein